MKLKKRVILVNKSICEAYLAKKMQEILSKKTIKCKKIPSQELHFNTTK